MRRARRRYTPRVFSAHHRSRRYTARLFSASHQLYRYTTRPFSAHGRSSRYTGQLFSAQAEPKRYATRDFSACKRAGRYTPQHLSAGTHAARRYFRRAFSAFWSMSLAAGQGPPVRCAEHVDPLAQPEQPRLLDRTMERIASARSAATTAITRKSVGFTQITPPRPEKPQC